MAQAEGAAASRPAVGKIVTPQDRADLKNYHVNRLVEAHLAVDLARAPLKEAQDELTNRVNQAKGDMGKRMTRKRLMGLVSMRLARVRDLVQEENERAEDHMDLSLPLYGQQVELFDSKAPVETRDEIAWEAEGYQAGRRGLLQRDPPKDCPARFAPVYLRGYDKGQDETQQSFVRAQEAMKKRGDPDAKAGAADLNGGDKDDDLDPQTIEAKARALRGKGFAGKPGAGGSKGKGASKPNLSVVRDASAPQSPPAAE